MSATSHDGHAHAPIANQQDPTRTTTLRRRFSQEFGGRFRTVKGLIRDRVGYETDFFGLASNADPEREREFIRWLRRVLDEEIVEVESFVGIRGGRHYTATYVRSAYGRALKDAGRQLRAEGLDVPVEELSTMFNLPVHESSLRHLYQRAYEDLDDITGPMAQAIREELTQGFVEGVNPRVMASRINDRVDAIGLTRARTLAQTRVIDAYSLGTLDRFERMGVEQVTIEAEWLTAGDDRVCPICASLEGQVWTISEARHGNTTLTEDDVRQFVPEGRSVSSFIGEFPVRPPAHPRCRCRLLPSVVS